MLRSEAMAVVMLPIVLTVADASAELADPSFSTVTIASTVLVYANDGIVLTLSSAASVEASMVGAAILDVELVFKTCVAMNVVGASLRTWSIWWP